MAEVERVPQVPSANGAEPNVYEALAADVQLIPNHNGNVMLRLTPAAAEEVEVTVVTPIEEGGNPVADKVIKVASGKTKVAGPFSPGVYNNAKNQLEIKTNKTVKIEVLSTGF